MYGYEEFIPLNEEEILKRVNQEEIIEMALGYKPISYQKITNPLRPKDKNPGAYFEWFNGKLWFIDFGDSITHRIPFKFISDFYNVSFIDALRIINTHFQLGLGSGHGLVAKPVVYHNIYQQQNHEKERAHIIYKPRPFSIRDKGAWFKFGIGRDQLIGDEVVPVIWYKIYSVKLHKWVVIRPKDNAYAFTEFQSKHVKILRPLANPSQKWTSNCDENDIFAFNKLPTVGHILVVQKSYKDCRIIRNHNLTSIGFQSEGCLPKDEIITDLCARFKSIPIFFDNDEAGIKAANKVSEHFNKFKAGISYPVYLPTHLNPEGITDPAELVSKKGHQELQNFLTEKGLYGTNSTNNT